MWYIMVVTKMITTATGSIVNITGAVWEVLNMDTKEYLQILRNEIHSTVFATLDEKGRPHTRVIDIMLVDDDSLYFITAKGKAFYDELTGQKFAAISGMTGGEGSDIAHASIEKKAISVRGYVKDIGPEKLDEVFEKNPYMAEIYPDENSRTALTVFRMSDGEGEFFDLSTKPITRESFILGNGLDGKKNLQEHGYFITDKCRGCRMCYSKCPQKCIDMSSIPFVIKQENCLHCGNCMSVCPFGAVEKR